MGFATDVLRRMRQHRYAANHSSNYPIHRAIKKYGWDNFLVETIFQSKDKKFILKEMEPYFIKEYNSLVDQNGYNITRGGEGTPGYKFKGKAKENFLKAKKEVVKRPNFIERMKYLGSHISEETRKKRSEANKKAWQNREIRMKMIEAQTKDNQRIEKRKLISEKAKIRWADPIFKNKMELIAA